jgi:hypothetical protein
VRRTGFGASGSQIVEACGTRLSLSPMRSPFSTTRVRPNLQDETSGHSLHRGSLVRQTSAAKSKIAQLRLFAWFCCK